MNRLSQFIFTSAVVVLVTCASCSSGSETDVGLDPSGAEVGGGVDPNSSPLFAALGISESLLFPMDPAAQQATHMMINDRVAACMAEEGFEWLPSPRTNAMLGRGEGFSGLRPDSREWAERYGFGVSTLMFSQDQVGPDLVGSRAHTIDNELRDPNEEYLGTLNEADQKAYRASLWGDENVEILEGSSSPEDLQAARSQVFAEPSGCLPLAQHEIFSVDSLAVLEEFGPDLDELYEAVRSDQEIVSLEAEMSRCLAGEGLEYLDPEDVVDRFFEELEPLLSTELSPGSTLSEAHREELRVIQEREVELGTATFDCAVKTDFDNIFNGVRSRYELHYLDANRQRIAAATE